MSDHLKTGNGVKKRSIPVRILFYFIDHRGLSFRQRLLRSMLFHGPVMTVMMQLFFELELFGNSHTFFDPIEVPIQWMFGTVFGLKSFYWGGTSQSNAATYEDRDHDGSSESKSVRG